MTCPSCQAENADTAETCFTCGQSLVTVIKRGTLIAARYEILSPLGRGGMGMVYKAHDQVLDDTVAIKVLRHDIAREPGIARRLRSEIRLARKITHRNVCRVHEYGEEGSLRYISMEFIDGVDLREVLREKGPFPPEDAFEVAIQVAEGLRAIHDVGVIHRDVKTANIMRDRRSVVRLMDFGIAKEWDAQGITDTATGHVMGTPEYMSPEQVRGERVDFRSDFYALGVVIFELFTAEVPFKGETPSSTMLKHLHEAAPLDAPHVVPIPGELLPLLRQALAKSPADRCASAQEMVDSLRQAREAFRTRAALLSGIQEAPTANHLGIEPVFEPLAAPGFEHAPPAVTRPALKRHWRRLLAAATFVGMSLAVWGRAPSPFTGPGSPTPAVASAPALNPLPSAPALASPSPQEDPVGDPRGRAPAAPEPGRATPSRSSGLREVWHDRVEDRAAGGARGRAGGRAGGCPGAPGRRRP